MSLFQKAQTLADATPSWANWTIIGTSWLVSYLQPVALAVTIVWGTLQIYTWVVNKGWRRKNAR